MDSCCWRSHKTSHTTRCTRRCISLSLSLSLSLRDSSTQAAALMPVPEELSPSRRTTLRGHVRDTASTRLLSLRKSLFVPYYIATFDSFNTHHFHPAFTSLSLLSQSAMDRQSVYSLSVLAPDPDDSEGSATQTQAQLREFILEFRLNNAFIYR